MIYAPVIIPTLCRSEHLIRCVESLKKNTWSDKTDVYIGLDYPSKENHWEGYNKIKKYLEGDFPEFHSFRVFIRKKNYGATRNTRALMKCCAKEHDRYLYVEDDLELSPNYLQYMDEALEAYKNDDSVVGVAGYSYPLPWKAASGCTVVKQNFNGSAWGRGFWFKKRKKLMRFLRPNGLSKSFAVAYRSGKFNQMIDFAIKDYVTMAKNGWSSKRGFLNSTTDVAMRIYLAVRQRYFIMPIISKVRNHGYDGTGCFCQRIEGNTNSYHVDGYAFSEQPIDTATDFTLIEDPSFPIEMNRKLLNSFDAVSSEEMEEVWKDAEQIASGGRYYGLIKRLKSFFFSVK